VRLGIPDSRRHATVGKRHPLARIPPKFKSLTGLHRLGVRRWWLVDMLVTCLLETHKQPEEFAKFFLSDTSGLYIYWVHS